MLYNIQNEYVTVSINAIGAELKSIKSSKGVEYLWQGNPEYWNGQAPNLFPYIARMTEGKYTFAGNTYEMGIHGFAKSTEFQVVEQSKEQIVFTIEESESTLVQYPFLFQFSVIYKLQGNKVVVEYKVVNKGDQAMYFGVGGHPGFNVPLDDAKFEDYYLEFAEESDAKRIEFSADCFVTGNKHIFEMIDGVKIPMQHNMFDEDAIVLTDMCREVTLKSDKGNKSIRVGYPEMKFIGFWHMPKTDAPYVCIEPWSTLPSRQGVVEELDKQPDIIELEGNSTYSNSWWIEIN